VWNTGANPIKIGLGSDPTVAGAAYITVAAGSVWQPREAPQNSILIASTTGTSSVTVLVGDARQL
jgi:hypothetical protein